jgi:hypothetical protein
MTELACVGLSDEERWLTIQALKNLKAVKAHEATTIDRVIAKLQVRSSLATIGVYGGQVQWVKGNLFPIRILDYDGDDEDLVDVDDEGHKCTAWVEPPDLEAVAVRPNA